MKRVIIACGLLVLSVLLCVLAELHMDYAVDSLEASLDAVEAAIETENRDELAQTLSELNEAWELHHKIMIRYIHNDELNAIHGTIARMRALSLYAEAFPELAAETAHLRQSIRLIRDAQETSFLNIL